MLVTVARTHWFGEDVENIETTLEAAPSLMPTFDRGPFGANRFHDVIERRPTGGADPLHIGLVSKQYVLVQHAAVVHAVTAEVTRAGIDPAQVPVSLLMTEYGTRIALRATLPENYAYTPDNRHSMALTFECFNSVDGTVPLFAAVGWFRFVCSNGLLVGTTSARVRQRHSPPLEIAEVCEVLAEGMESALEDRKSFAAWRSTKVSRSNLEKWVDGPVAGTWGPLAAARVYGISTTGVDSRPRQPFRKAAPHRWQLTEGLTVPGTQRAVPRRLRDRAGPGLGRRTAHQRGGTPPVAGADSRPDVTASSVNYVCSALPSAGVATTQSRTRVHWSSCRRIVRLDL